jgi:hypothetical protein
MRPQEKARRKRARRKLRWAWKLEHLNDNTLCRIFAYVPSVALTAVCRRWRALLWDIRGVDIFHDLTAVLPPPPPKVYRVYLYTPVRCGCGRARATVEEIERAIFHHHGGAKFIVCTDNVEVFTGFFPGIDPERRRSVFPERNVFPEPRLMPAPLPELIQRCVKGKGLRPMQHHE